MSKDKMLSDGKILFDLEPKGFSKERQKDFRRLDIVNSTEIKKSTLVPNGVMTIGEVAIALNYSRSTVEKIVRKLWPDLMKHGKTTYLNEEQCTIIKMQLTTQLESFIDPSDNFGKNSEVVIGTQISNINTIGASKLEKQLVIQQALQYSNELVTELQLENERLQIKTEKQALQIEEDRPKVEFYNHVADSTDLIDFEEMGKLIGIGRNTLMDKLRDEEVLYYKGRDNVPKQKYITRGYFKMLERENRNERTGDVHLYFKTYITTKGQDWLVKKFKK